MKKAGKKASNRNSPAAKTSAPPSKPTVNDLIDAAKRRFMAQERLDIGELAAELGVARVTAFRWVGNRETLYGHVLASLFTNGFDQIDRQLPGHGMNRDLELLRRVFQGVVEFAPMRHFVAADPAFAMRVISSKDGPCFRRSAALIHSVLERSARASALTPVLPLDQLAPAVLVIANAFLFGDAFGGRGDDVDSTMAIVRVVLMTGMPAQAVPQAPPAPMAEKPRRRKGA